MVKAHSLLYAIYVCLIVALLCGALLYLANLYNQLNLYYVTRSDLYIHNQSAVNYALGNINNYDDEFEDNNSGIVSIYKTRQFGLYKLLVTQSLINTDTVTSLHLAGQYNLDKTCLYLTNYSKPLTYSGKLVLNGEKKLPSQTIREVYIDRSKANKLVSDGPITISDFKLPNLNPDIKSFFERKYKANSLTAVEKENDSIYFNSFLSEVKDIELESQNLSGMIIKGNFILHSRDSIYVRNTTVLEDVILIAPSIRFEDGFKGTVQAFATKSITVGSKSSLEYPSVLCLYNNSLEKSSIKIKKESHIKGGIVLFGFPHRTADKNFIEIENDGLIIGDIYCSGILMLKSNVYGSVYTDRFLYQASSSRYENCIADLEINVSKRPKYFISTPFFEGEKSNYGLAKKLL
jgi:hypothetical protein